MDESVPAADVLIVGSGPVGATFARVLFEQAPEARIVMVDLGPQLTPVAGMNIRNLRDCRARDEVRHLLRGADVTRSDTSGMRDMVRAGTHPIDGAARGMAAAAHSSNVGGMGAHWSCATPRPGGTERIDAIPAAEWSRLLARAEGLLWTTRDPLPLTADKHHMLKTLGGLFDSRLVGPRKVAPMPLACVPSVHGGRVWWAGADSVLGPLIQGDPAVAGRFALRCQTVCREVLTNGGRVNGAVLHHLPTATSQVVSARVVIAAADALRTPQLLWASGIRPSALGHYLNDQPQLVATVPGRGRDNGIPGCFWVPFDDHGHPHHGQVMQLHSTSLALIDSRERGPDETPPVVLTWFCRKEVRFEDRVEFIDEVDSCGLPKISINYEVTAADGDAIGHAMSDLVLAADALGGFVHEPRVLPAGSSLHYQGTVRMGEREDGASVCDTYSRVWGMQNLYVGGNGVIPTATACNPTLTSVALAVRSAEHIAHMIRR
jgi:choline dehydrogenase-like flavoprotein